MNQKKLLAGILEMVLFIFAWFSGCSNFPSRFDNIEEDKTRPLAVILEPAEAAPGDTVLVRYYGYQHTAPIYEQWDVYLDMGFNLMGFTSVEGNKVAMSTLSLPGGTVDSFRFVVPRNTLAQSTMLKGMFRDSLAYYDSLLASLPPGPGVLPPELLLLVDQFRSNIKLALHMEADITLDVTRQLTVRYSRKFSSPNVNHNPGMKWVGIYSIKNDKQVPPESVSYYNPRLQYLYNPNDPAQVNDTVDIDTGHYYYLAADSGDPGIDSGRQAYEYFSLIDSIVRPDTEEINIRFFYTNLDYAPSMEMDSLIVLQGGMVPYCEILLPPVETGMHRFRIYAIARDDRSEEGMFQSPGQWFSGPIEGYFRYSQAYIAAH